MKKKLLAAILVTIMVIAMLPFSAFASDSTISIKTSTDLVNALKEMHNGTYKSSDVTLMLDADIDMDGVAWESMTDAYAAPYLCDPNHSNANYFNGTFDGNGHTIYNLSKSFDVSDSNFDCDVDSADFTALIGSLGPNGVVKNLTIEKANLDATNVVAAIVGYSEGTITNCAVNNSKIVSHEVVGYWNGSRIAETIFANAESASGTICGINNGVISSCSSSGNTITRGGANAGGIVGINCGKVDTCTGSDNTITNTLTKYDESYPSGYHGHLTIGSIGGIVGWNNVTYKGYTVELTLGITTNCTNYSDMSATRSTGGICGYNSDGLISNCINYGNIKTDESLEAEGIWVGGICGDMWQLLDAGAPQLLHCANYGNVEGIADVGGIMGRSDYMVGGLGESLTLGDFEEPEETLLYVDETPLLSLTGDNNLLIKNCLNQGDVIASQLVGGIIGKSDALIIGCFNTGNVTLRGQQEEGKNYLVGGICASSNNGIDYCGNSGTVSSEMEFFEDESCPTAIGGIAGLAKSSHIKTSYNIAPVKINVDAENWGYDIVLGGVAGSVHPDLLNDCYFADAEKTMAKYANGFDDESDGPIDASDMRGLEAKTNMPGLFKEGSLFAAHENFLVEGYTYATSPYISSAFMDETTVAIVVGVPVPEPDPVPGPVPKTADNNNLFIWIILLIISIGIIGTSVYLLKFHPPMNLK